MARKILLADDSVTAQNMGRKILADAGYEVVTVNNGSAALKRIAELKPDLIVLDVYMPGYSGLEVCQRLKEAQETARIPVLLTVGKLEPFKPEEAKRARADGFIVKPFEASELLSALTKLEDKIVPRSEGSKPGRFARSIAAIEEGRYDKSMAPEEDAGWKNRINFPSAKKAKTTEAEDGEDPAIYNAVNKDLRTTVDQRSNANPPRETAVETAHQRPREAATEDARVDLGALAPLGLPKDVTPEEIAALAAAAAQVQSSLAAKKSTEIAAGHVTTEPVTTEQAPAQHAPTEHSSTEHVSTEHAATALTSQPQPDAATQADSAAGRAQSKAEESSAEKIEAAPLSSIPAEMEIPKAAPEGASTDSTPAVGAAFTQMPPATVALVEGHSGNGTGGHDAVATAADEPVTMAMATGAGSVAAASRWSAVAVAVAPEEAALSLENEMQKAFAAFAAVEGLTESKVEPSAPKPVEEFSPAEAMPRSQAAPVQNLTSSATAAPEVAQPEVEMNLAQTNAAQASVAQASVAHTMEVVASVATEAISAAIKELETVAASYAEQEAPMPPASSEESHSVKAVAEENVSARLAPDFSAKAEESPLPVQKNEDAQPAGALAYEKSEVDRGGDARNSEVAVTAVKSEVRASEVPADEIPANAVMRETAEVAGADESKSGESSSRELGAPAHGGVEEMAKKESEIAATTAAAWASWRRIRETGNSKGSAAMPEDAAAMAVAAGAEKAPEEPAAFESDPEGIANIVDSVLADLRPKIVEEISRKLGKKK